MAMDQLPATSTPARAKGRTTACTESACRQAVQEITGWRAVSRKEAQSTAEAASSITSATQAATTTTGIRLQNATRP